MRHDRYAEFLFNKRARLNQLKAEMRELQTQRHLLRVAIASRLGDLSLGYRPETNQPVRLSFDPFPANEPVQATGMTEAEIAQALGDDEETSADAQPPIVSQVVEEPSMGETAAETEVALPTDVIAPPTVELPSTEVPASVVPQPGAPGPSENSVAHAPAKDQEAPPTRTRAERIRLFAAEAFAWILVLPLGAFTGYSVGLLAGFPVRAERVYTIGSIIFGAALLSGMKMAITKIVYVAMRHSRRQNSRAILIATIIVSVLIAAEAGLATVAIQRYSIERAVRPEEILPIYVAALIGVCFSTPILLAAAFSAWYGAFVESKPGDLETRRAEAEFRRDEALRDREDENMRRRLETEAAIEAERMRTEREQLEAAQRAETARREQEAAHEAEARRLELQRYEEETSRRDQFEREAEARRIAALADFERAANEWSQKPDWRAAISMMNEVETIDLRLRELAELLVQTRHSTRVTS